MKKITLIIFIFSMTLCFAQKQTIVQVEYYTDPATQPGTGTQVQLPDLGTNSVDIKWDSLPPLKPGTSFFVRVKSSGFTDIKNNTKYGVWSMPVMVKYPTTAFITAAEVQLVRSNSNPIKKVITPSDSKFDSPSELLDVVLACSDVQAGDTLQVRLRGKDELWGEWTGIEIRDSLLKPTRPDNLTAKNIGTFTPKVELNWIPSNSGVLKYIIERKEGTLSWKKIDSVNAGVTQYIDISIVSDKTYSYRVQAISYKTCLNSDYSVVASINPVGVEDNLLNDFKVFIYPNPVSQNCNISFYTKEFSFAKLTIVNCIGNEIAVLSEGFVSKGEHQVAFNAEHFSTGLYFYILQINNEMYSGKVFIIK
ncbi:MAG: 5'-nucleotidase protein [Ignavibacteria bacterium]|nr:5'-nucleotidase protein [Ignavibacteria bacterium]